MSRARGSLCAFAVLALVVLTSLSGCAGVQSTSAGVSAEATGEIFARLIEKVTDEDDKNEASEREAYAAREQDTEEWEKRQEAAELGRKELAQSKEAELEQESEWH
jgi:hypothetical protein